MKVYLGIDIGGSGVKLTAADGEGNMLAGTQYASDGSNHRLVSEARELLGKLSAEPCSVCVTGVGADIAGDNFLGLPVSRYEEFGCFGRGALRLSGADRAIVVSMGTGTAFVRADGDRFTHLGGSGVGGGTLGGLASLLCGTRDNDEINALISAGDAAKTDLAVGDICKGTVGGLSADVTAANFGKKVISENKADVAAGIANMIFQTAGVMAAFCCKGTDINKAVFVGAMSGIPRGRDMLLAVGKLHGLDFTVPEGGVYAGALGAVLTAQASEKV